MVLPATRGFVLSGASQRAACTGPVKGLLLETSRKDWNMLGPSAGSCSVRPSVSKNWLHTKGPFCARSDARKTGRLTSHIWQNSSTRRSFQTPSAPHSKNRAKVWFSVYLRTCACKLKTGIGKFCVILVKFVFFPYYFWLVRKASIQFGFLSCNILTEILRKNTWHSLTRNNILLV